MRSITFIVAAIGAVLLTAHAQAEEATRPNFVIVMTDDQSPMPWAREGHYHNSRAFGYCGADDVYTPHIDRLAADGVVFTAAYVSSSVCSPSRYSLLTGRYAGRCSGPSFTHQHPAGTLTRVENNTELELDRPNVAKLLSDAGYDTGFVGKCHIIDHHLYDRRFWSTPKGEGLQSYDRNADPRNPEIASRMRNNYEFWRERIGQYGFTWTGGIYSANLLELGSAPLNVHNVDWTTNAAMEFLDKPRSGPFFLYYATTIPHGPYPWGSDDERGDYWAGVNADPAMTGEGYRDDHAEEWASYRNDAKQTTKAKGKPMDEAWLTWFDASIGRLRDKLEANGQLENTVFIVLSDHGSWRFGKTTLYQGGVRVPLLVHWPAGAKAGHKHEALVQNIDLTPTVLDLAGVDTPADDPVDGKSLADALKGDQLPERESLFFELGYARGVTDGRWKYIAVRYNEPIERKIERGGTWASFKNKQGRIARPYLTRNPHLGHHASLNNPHYFEADQLYDLEADPREENNVFADCPDVARRMQDLLKRHLATFEGRPFGEFTE